MRGPQRPWQRGEPHPREGLRLTVSSGWVLATSHGREAEQGQGAEQVSSSSEPQADRRRLVGAKLERSGGPGTSVTGTFLGPAPAGP